MIGIKQKRYNVVSATLRIFIVSECTKTQTFETSANLTTACLVPAYIMVRSG
jgi:hypothetical protein